MIVRCERCDTRFKLDESRLPARGARVRCSRCKHAFFVIPPGTSREERVHDVAARTAAAPNPAKRSPGPTWDLEDGTGEASSPAPSARTATASSQTASASEPEENDWRFEDDVPSLGSPANESSLDLTGSMTAPSLLPSPEPDGDSFADLGDPETWDLLANDAPAAPPAPEPTVRETAPAEATPAAPAEPIPSPVPAPALAVARAIEGPVRAPATTSLPAAPAESAASAAPPAVTGLAPAARAAGWLAVTALSAAVAWVSLSVPATSPAVALAPVAGFDVIEARTRILDNAAAGPVLLVSGRLRNPASEPRTLGSPLRVQLLDAAGQPLAGASALAGPVLPTRRVREEAPEALRAAQEAGAAELARRSVAGGGDLSFDAVFADPPRAAASAAFAAQAPTPIPTR